MSPAAESAPNERAAGEERPRADPSVLRALLKLASLVTTTTGEDGLVEAVAETARELLLADSLTVSRVEDDGTTLAVVVNVGELGPWEERWPQDERYRFEDFPQTMACFVGAPTVRWATRIDDPDAEPAERALLRSLGKESSLKTPIVVGGELWGELWASRGHGVPPFDDGDSDLAAVIVALVAAGLAQADAWRAVQAQASTDAMTGLPNRRAFDAHLAAHLEASQSAGRPLSLLVGDVDGLKICNDTQGHAAGDDALMRVAGAARTVVADLPDALAARLGGDEFVVVLPGHDGAAALELARRWCDLSRHEGHGTSLSCGVAVATAGESADPRHLVMAGDEALYAAKSRRGAGPVLAARART